MKKITATTLAVLMSTSVYAQNGQNGQIANSHKPNEYTLACLEAPTRDCAFSAALQTVIAEEFGVERSKVLVAVARALIETGQQSQAIDTLMLALEEARSVNLSLVTQEKISEIAPILARANDTAGALALVEELQINSVRQRVLIAIARENIAAGRVADANVALSQMESPTRAFWQRLRLLPTAPVEALRALDMVALEAEVRAFDQSDRLYRGLILLAVLADKRGALDARQAYIAEADELFTNLVSLNGRALATAHRLRSMYDGGLDATLIEESYALGQRHISRVRSTETQESIASLVGVVEANTGRLDAAIRRMAVFKEVADKARYISSLRSPSDLAPLSAEVSALLVEVVELDGVYERDLVRLQLLEGALSNKDLALATNLIIAIEDDDNQAKGLALTAPLLQ